MTKDEFETRLRHYIYQDPFQPFVVHLLDGRRVTVDQLPVVFSDGAASFVDFKKEALVEFFCDQVVSFGPLEQEVHA